MGNCFESDNYLNFGLEEEKKMREREAKLIPDEFKFWEAYTAFKEVEQIDDDNKMNKLELWLDKWGLGQLRRVVTSEEFRKENDTVDLRKVRLLLFLLTKHTPVDYSEGKMQGEYNDRCIFLFEEINRRSKAKTESALIDENNVVCLLQDLAELSMEVLVRFFGPMGHSESKLGAMKHKTSLTAEFLGDILVTPKTDRIEFENVNILFEKHSHFLRSGYIRESSLKLSVDESETPKIPKDGKLEEDSRETD